MVKIGEKTRLGILLSLLAVAGLTYYEISHRPALVFKKDTSYFMSGKNRDCNWQVFFEKDVYLKRGSFSNVFIGLPEKQKLGAIKGIVESTDSDLLLAFSFPGKFSSPPIVLTSRHQSIKIPYESVRFKLLNSSILTILIYKDQETCMKMRGR
jgi:hypothetical protein